MGYKPLSPLTLRSAFRFGILVLKGNQQTKQDISKSTSIMESLCGVFVVLFLITCISIKRAREQSDSFLASYLLESGVTTLPQCNTSMPAQQRYACYCTQEVLA